MIRGTTIGSAVILMAACGVCRADQGWQDNQDGSNFACYDVGTLQVNGAVRFNALDQGPTTSSVVLAPTGGDLFTTNQLQYYGHTLIAGPAVGTAGIGEVTNGGLFVTSSAASGDAGNIFLYDADACSTTTTQGVYFQAPVTNIDTFGAIYYTPLCYTGTEAPPNSLIIENIKNLSMLPLANPIYIMGVTGSHSIFQAQSFPGDGSELWGDSSPSVSTSTTCGIASIGGVLEQSCHGSSWAPFGGGTVTSVTGSAGRITVTPSSPNPVVDLATFGTASTCAWANVVTDAYGRTTCTANTVPQPAGNYITALTHDVTATGPGSVAAEVTGITDGTSVDHQVAAGAWTNSQALALDGSGNIHTAAFQAPLTACTDYVSVSCQGGTSDIGTGGSNSAVQVTAIHEAFGPSRIPFGNINASGQALIYDGSVIAGYPPAGDLSGSYVTGPKTACKVNWYTQQTNMVASAWVPISDMTNLTTNQAELPCDHKATTGTLYVNIVANGLTGGSVLIYITRNGGGFGATLTVTSGTATGVHSVGASTGSGSANDTYGLFFDGITGSATGTLLVFSAEAVLN